MMTGSSCEPSQNVIPSELCESRDPPTSPESVEQGTFSDFRGSLDFARLRRAPLGMTLGRPANPKFEIRNPKFPVGADGKSEIRNPKSEIPLGAGQEFKIEN